MKLNLSAPKSIITPHITIYKMQVNSLISIIFRVTAVGLTLLLGLLIFLITNDILMFGYILIESSLFVFLSGFVIGITVVFLGFHMLAGILHILKDRL